MIYCVLFYIVNILFVIVLYFSAIEHSVYFSDMIKYDKISKMKIVTENLGSQNNPIY